MFSANGNTTEIVFIGAGPVGLITAINLLDKKPDAKIVMIERNKEYKRTQRLKLNVSLIENQEIKKQILNLLKTNEASNSDEKNHVDIPIQSLEKILSTHAKKKIEIVYKRFVTAQQFSSELMEHKVATQAELESKLKQEIIVDVEGILKLYPHCKMIVGSDGSRSSVRDLILEDEKQTIDKIDFRNLIEIQYQVHGKVKKLNKIDYFTTQALLQGFLCTEYVKFDDKKNKSEVTLRFLVDSETFNDKRLEKVNAKNLLSVSENLPKKLVHAITIWANKRKDKNIVLGSVKLNKTTLSLYSSKKYCVQTTNVMIYLIGDAACGFPYMNGLNLGIACGNEFVNILVNRYKELIYNNNYRASQEFSGLYIDLVKRTVEKGRTRVISADRKITSNQKSISFFHYSSYPIEASMTAVYNKPHAIIYSHGFSSEELAQYIQNNIKKLAHDKMQLAKNLLSQLDRGDYDFEYTKALLILAYIKNRRITMKGIYSSFSSYLFPSKSKNAAKNDLTSLPENDVRIHMQLINFQIPDILVDDDGKKLSQGLHKIIKNLYQKAIGLEIYYRDNCKEQLKSFIPEDNGMRIIGEYLKLKM